MKKNMNKWTKKGMKLKENGRKKNSCNKNKSPAFKLLLSEMHLHKKNVVFD